MPLEFSPESGVLSVWEASHPTGLSAAPWQATWGETLTLWSLCFSRMVAASPLNLQALGQGYLAGILPALAVAGTQHAGCHLVAVSLTAQILGHQLHICLL